MDREPKFGVLFDLDDTLILTSPVEPLRRRGRWREVYRAFPSTSLPKGTIGFLGNVKRFADVAIVTSSPRSYAEKLLRYHGLSVPVAVAYHDVLWRKPHPEPVLKGVEYLQVSLDRCVYIGDQPSDIRAAVSAGIRGIGISWGGTWQDSETGSIAYAVCYSWDDVLAVITELAVGGEIAR